MTTDLSSFLIGWAIPPKPYNPDKDKDKPEKEESTEEGKES